MFLRLPPVCLPSVNSQPQSFFLSRNIYKKVKHTTAQYETHSTYYIHNVAPMEINLKTTNLDLTSNCFTHRENTTLLQGYRQLATFLNVHKYVNHSDMPTSHPPPRKDIQYGAASHLSHSCSFTQAYFICPSLPIGTNNLGVLEPFAKKGKTVPSVP